jgi:hypothetical protein
MKFQHPPEKTLGENVFQKGGNNHTQENSPRQNECGKEREFPRHKDE